jgi:trigger factor
MEYTITRNEEAEADILIKFNVEDLNQAFEKAFIRAKDKVKVNGFRQGKAPMELVKKAIKEEALTEDTIQDLLNHSLHEIGHKLDFSPYDYPKLAIEKFDRKVGLSVKASYEKAPQVTLGEYKNLSYTKLNLLISDEDIQKDIEDIRKKLSKTASKEENDVIEEKDFIEMKVLSFLGEEKIHNVDEQRFEMGEVPELLKFEQELLGLKVGDEKTFDFTYPENKSLFGEIAGSTLKFTVSILTILKVVLPEIDDNLAQEWNGTETLVKLKEDIKKLRSDSFEKELKRRDFILLLKQIVKNSKFIIPASLLKAEKDAIFKRIQERTGMKDLTLEKYSSAIEQTTEEVETNFSSQAEINIKNYLAIQKITAEEQLLIEPKEIEKIYQDVTISLSKKPDKTQKTNIINNIYNNLSQDKVENFLLSNAKVKKEEEISIDKAKEILNSQIEEN